VRGIAVQLVAASLLLAAVGFTAACEPIDAPGVRSSGAASSSADGVTPSGTTTRSGTPVATPRPTAQPTDEPAAPTAEAGEAQPAAQTALAAARLLAVKGRAPMTGYDRAQFGQAWKDTDRNGCDQRNDVLGRDLTGVVYKAGTHDCLVLTGVLADPYGGTTINFTRGQATSNAVQIDHVVALADAWQKGAQQWGAAARESFANDLVNLLAVDGPLNLEKGSGDTATWLPPNKAYRCAYVARQVGVKVTYGLWVTQAEQDAMVRVLSTCPEQPMPTGSATASASSDASRAQARAFITRNSAMKSVPSVPVTIAKTARPRPWPPVRAFRIAQMPSQIATGPSAQIPSDSRPT
jgi:Protein of unknown function (DUF1524)